MARADLDGWVSTYRERVLDHVKGVDGFQSVAFHAEREGDPCKVTVLMKWDDMGAVKQFLEREGGTIEIELGEQDGDFISFAWLITLQKEIDLEIAS